MARRWPFTSLLEALPGISFRRATHELGWRFHHDPQVIGKVRPSNSVRYAFIHPSARMTIQIGLGFDGVQCALWQNESIEWDDTDGRHRSVGNKLKFDVREYARNVSTTLAGFGCHTGHETNHLRF